MIHRIKEKPIIFNSEMVRAILEGRKTETRRVVKNTVHKSLAEMQNLQCPYGEPDDRLWVRETFYINHFEYELGKLPKQIPDDIEGNEELYLYYRADGECCQQFSECECGDVDKPKWRPSIFMPRWASRINLEIEEIRIERLQDIDMISVMNEGLYEHCSFCKGHDSQCTDCLGEGIEPPHINKWIYLWDSINKKRGYGWDSNPWVWVIKFKKIT